MSQQRLKDALDGMVSPTDRMVSPTDSQHIDVPCAHDDESLDEPCTPGQILACRFEEFVREVNGVSASSNTNNTSGFCQGESPSRNRSSSSPAPTADQFRKVVQRSAAQQSANKLATADKETTSVLRHPTWANELSSSSEEGKLTYLKQDSSTGLSVEEMCVQLYDMVRTFSMASGDMENGLRLSRLDSNVSLTSPRSNSSPKGMFEGGDTSVRMLGGGMFEILPTHDDGSPRAGQTSLGNSQLSTLSATSQYRRTILHSRRSQASVMLGASTKSMVRHSGAPQFARYKAQSETNDVGMTVIAEYEIIAELGRGSFGTVCLAFDSRDQPVAIKTMHRGTRIAGGNSERPMQSSSNSVENPLALKEKRGKLTLEGSGFGSLAHLAASQNADRNVVFSRQQNRSHMESTSSNGSFFGGSASRDGREAAVQPGEAGSLSPGSSHTDPLASDASMPGAPLTKGQEAQQLVEREIAVMKALRHKNIVQLYAVIEDEAEEQCHLVMQYVENGPMAKMESDGSCDVLSVELAVDYMCQVSSGLDYLHRHGIIHRDIKPENILIGKGHTAYVADFGVSGVVNDMRGGGVKTAGTMAFFAPEMFSCADAAAKYGKESDVWAFGVSLYCITVGTLPFKGFNGPSMVRAIMAGDLKFPDSLSQEQCPDTLRGVIRRLLNPDPEKRMTLTEFRRHPFNRQYQKTWTEAATETTLIPNNGGSPGSHPLAALVHNISPQTKSSASSQPPSTLSSTRNMSEQSFQSGASYEVLADLMVPVANLPREDQPISLSNQPVAPPVPGSGLKQPHAMEEEGNDDPLVISEQDVKGAISHMGVSLVRRTNNMSSGSTAVVKGFANKLKNAIRNPARTRTVTLPALGHLEARSISPDRIPAVIADPAATTAGAGKTSGTSGPFQQTKSLLQADMNLSSNPPPNINNRRLTQPPDIVEAVLRQEQ